MFKRFFYIARRKSRLSAEQEYDAIGDKYHDVVENTDDRASLFVPTLKKYLPTITGMEVIDIATGSGYWARLLKNLGARTVTGTDISAEQVRIAKQIETQSPLGITYIKHDARTPFDHGVYDFAFAAFFLHYAETREQLYAMCQSIASTLRSGGTFLTFNSNPEHPEFDGRKYQCHLQAEKGLYEGAPITVTIFDKTKKTAPFSFHNYYWTKKTYEDALRAAGFSTISWHKLTVSEEGVKQFPEGYWDDYLAVSNPILIECHKA